MSFPVLPAKVQKNFEIRNEDGLRIWHMAQAYAAAGNHDQILHISKKRMTPSKQIDNGTKVRNHSIDIIPTD